MDEKVVYPNPSLSDVSPLSPKIKMEDGWSCPHPFDSDWISTEDPN